MFRISIPVSAQTSQNVQKKLTDLDFIIYQYPRNGDNNISSGTSLIIRPNSRYMRGLAASDFSFTVTGDRSGYHKGKSIFSDDTVTVMFIPDIPFTENENVSATFSLPHVNGSPSYSYHFHITSLSIQKQQYWQQYFDQKYENENAAFRRQTASKAQLIEGIEADTLPSYFPKLQVDLNTGGSDSGNIFLTPIGHHLTTQFAFITIADNTGAPIFWREILGKGPSAFPVTADFKMLPNNNLVYPAAIHETGVEYGVGSYFEMNTAFKNIDSFAIVGNDTNGNTLHSDVHDFELLPNGHAILDAYVPIKIDSSIVYDNIIQEIDKNKHPVFQWSALAHFRIGDATQEDTLGAQVDFAHLNSFQTDTDGNILASFRNLDAVVKINRQTGDIIWKWGGKHNQFTFLGDTLKFSHQHHVRRIANGHITMFDNGNYHSSFFQGTPVISPSSRAIEYELDEINHKVTAVWQYKNIPFSNAAGSVQRLPNGNTLIGLGNVGSPAVIEVTPTNDLVFQLSLPPQSVSYRAYRFNLPQSLVNQTTTSDNSFGIQGIYPNPAESFTTLSFLCSQAGTAQLQLVDLLGHPLLTEQKFIQKGISSVTLDLRNISSGIYYCKVTEGGHTIIKSIAVQK